MIQKLIQQIGLQKINAKINEFDAEINRLKEVSTNRPTRENIGSYIENAVRDIRNAIKNAKDNLAAAIELIKNKIKLYYTKDESDALFDRIQDLSNFLLKDQNITLRKNLNVGKSIELNNTSGPVITFPDGSLEIRPGVLKVTNNGNNVFEIRDNVVYNNGQEVVTGISRIGPGNWIELPNSRNLGVGQSVYYGDAVNDDANQLLILMKYTDRIDNDHMYIDHVLIELSLGVQRYAPAYCTINLANNYIKLESAKWNGTIHKVFYR